MSFRTPIMAVAASLLLLASPATSLVIFNDTFDAPSYSEDAFNGADSGSNPDDLSEAFFSDTSGGNPGGAGEILHVHAVDRDEFFEPISGDGQVDLQSFFVEQTFTWTPSTDGEITSINFMIDVLNDTFGSEGGFFFDIFFQVSDVGGGSFGGFTSIDIDSDWQNISVDLLPGDFSGRDFAGSDPLSFGFGFLSTSDVFFDDESVSLLVDNFKVTINDVPEPGTLALLGLGGVLLAARRRR